MTTDLHYTQPEVARVLAGEARYCVICADYRDIAELIPDRSVTHCIFDPPYSRLTHEGMRGTVGAKTNGKHENIVTRDCGFNYLLSTERRFLARHSCRVSQKWIGVFTDRESSSWWRISITAAGGAYARTIPWVRWSSPQFNKLKPPSGAEDVVWAKARPGVIYFNGTDRMCYDDKCLRASNKIGEHPTEKSEPLMLDVVGDVAEAGDIVLDWTCGSGTTLVAALRLGCRVIGIEKKPEFADVARKRCEAECNSMTLKALQSNQVPLFGEQR